MATSSKEPEDQDEVQRLSRAAINRAIFGGPSGRLRFTQDSPILPDVWIAYAKNPLEPQDLLINPYRGERSGSLSRELRKRVKLIRGEEDYRWVDKAKDVSPRIAHVPGLIVANLYFNELLRVILPNTFWWNQRIPDLRRALGLDMHAFNKRHGASLTQDPKLFPLGGDKERDPPPTDAASRNRQQEVDQLAKLIMEEAKPAVEEEAESDPDKGSSQRDAMVTPPHDLLKLVEIVGLIALAKDGLVDADGTVLTENGDPSSQPTKDLVTAFNEVFIGWPLDSEHWPTRNTIWSITRNRPADVGGNDSSKAMKADAGRSLFNVNCTDIRWAIIDSGIDSKHPAFTNWGHCDPRKLSQSRTPRWEMMTDDNRPSRVIRTYDFGDLRDLQDIEFLDRLHERLRRKSALSQQSDERQLGGDDQETLDERIERLQMRIHMAASREVGATPDQMEGLDRKAKRKLEKGARDRAAAQVKLLRDRLETGLELDWAILEDFIQNLVPERPRLAHGTQVASVLAANWHVPGTKKTEDEEEEDTDLLPGEHRKGPPKHYAERMVGVCPEIEILDFRVMSKPLFKEGRDAVSSYRTHDFEVISALQFIRHLNAHADEPYIHGANISLSIPHDVSRFACGRTPVCEECERLVANGVAVAVAAGNSGYVLPEGDSSHEPFYRMASITDPGNAEAVITVGATHRDRPHQYGISYFSSRGPTGDGRAKPDVVAPGEKIEAASPFGRSRSVDGTSFAAPHVSGAAALLMARHSELIGQPKRIKDILCSTATDLGRERYCQGAGMLDVLRALQSV